MDAMRFRKKLEHDGEIVLKGLPGKKGDEAEVIVLFDRPAGGTLGDLLSSGIAGMWKDRTDIGDSVEYARELRKAVQRRRH